MGLRRPGQRRAARHRRRRSRFQTMAQLSREPKLRQSTGRRRSPTQAWRLKRGGADGGPRELLSRDLPSEPARNDGRGGGNFNNQGRPLKASCRARHGRRRWAILLRRGAMSRSLFFASIVKCDDLRCGLSSPLHITVTRCERCFWGQAYDKSETSPQVGFCAFGLSRAGKHTMGVQDDRWCAFSRIGPWAPEKRMGRHPWV